jgi:RNA polymerase sigma factor (sigma-70 family)
MTQYNVEPRAGLTEDQILMARCRSGDGAAFAEIDRRFRSDLEALVKGRLPLGIPKANAEDIVQDTLVDFFNYRKKLEPATNLRPLIYRIAEHNIADYIRAQQADQCDYRRTRRLEDSCGDDTGSDDEQPSEQQGCTDPMAARKKAAEEAERLLREIMPRLPARWAIAVRLVWLERYSEKDAAKLLNITERTIQRWIKEAKEELRRLASA